MKQNLLMSVFAASALTATVLVPIDQAQAFSFFADINPSTSFSSNAPPYDPGQYTGASALLKFTFTQQGSQVLLDLLVENTTDTNTSDGAGATKASLLDIYFDLPSIVEPFSAANYNGGTVFPNIAFNQEFQPFTNNPPAGYPGAGAAPNVPFDVALSFAGGNPANGLNEDEPPTLVKLLFNTTKTAQEVEAAFHWGFLNVDGSSYIKADPLRLALRFQDVNAGEESDKLLAKPKAIPTPALLPALLGLGLGVLRKKQQSEQEA